MDGVKRLELLISSILDRNTSSIALDQDLPEAPLCNELGKSMLSVGGCSAPMGHGDA